RPSNLGSQFLVDKSLSHEEQREKVLDIVHSTFKPEFLNRLDDIVLFDALDQAELASIVDLQIEHMSQRLSDRRISLEVTQAAEDFLAPVSYDPAFGPQPQRCLAQRDVGYAPDHALPAVRVKD